MAKRKENCFETTVPENDHIKVTENVALILKYRIIKFCIITFDHKRIFSFVLNIVFAIYLFKTIYILKLIKKLIIVFASFISDLRFQSSLELSNEQETKLLRFNLSHQASASLP